MPPTARELGRRLRQAREACRLTREQAGQQLELSQARMAQLEAGRRKGTSLELERMASLYGRDLKALLAEEPPPEDAVALLSWAHPELAKKRFAAPLRKAICLAREISELEQLLELDTRHVIPAGYLLQPPQSEQEAEQQGRRVAREERARLELGSAPLPHVVELLEAQGLRTELMLLPPNVRGIAIHTPAVGPLIISNARREPPRRRFYYVHEYGHLLMDREDSVTVSRTEARGELGEVRANSFAESFLMPESGVLRFLEGLGRVRRDLETSALPAEPEAGKAPEQRRAGARAIHLHHLVQVAAHFRVSAISALYRLRNMKPPLVTQREFDALRLLVRAGKAKRTVAMLGLERTELEQEGAKFRHRLLGLGLEALRRRLISRAKLTDLARLVGLPPTRVVYLIEDAGIEYELWADVLVPSGLTAGKKRQTVVVATNFILGLIRLDRLELLGKLRGYGFVLPEHVLEAVTRPRERRRLREAIRKKHLKVVSINDPAEAAVYAELRRMMGQGQASCLAVAEGRGLLVASNEKAPFRLEAVRRLGPGRTMTTPGLIGLAIRQGLATVEEADVWKQALERTRLRMTFESFRELEAEPAAAD